MACLSRDTDHSAFDTSELNHLAHFSVSSAMSLPKSAGEPAKHDAAQVGESRLHLGIGESGINLLVELVDDLGGGIPGRADAVPAAGLIAWDEFATVGMSGSASKRVAVVTAKCAQLAGLDVRDRWRNEPNMPAPVHRAGRLAPGRHRDKELNHVDAGHHLEQLAATWGECRFRRRP